jgi:hypothetical protein
LLHLSSSTITESRYTATDTGGRTWRIGTGDNTAGLSGAFRIYDETGAATRLYITNAGNVGIGTTSPATTLDVNGDVTITDKIIHGGDTNTAIRFPAADTVSVETNGSERARIDSIGRLLVGTSSARSTFIGGASTPYVQFEGAGGIAGRVVSQCFGQGASAEGPILVLGKHRGSTVGSITAAADADECGQLVFSASDGTNFVQAASIRANVDGTPGTNDMPGRLVFSTTADGASSPSERFAICNDGRITTNRNFTATGSGTDDGFTFLNNTLLLSRNNDIPLLMRRRSSDGDIILFRRDTTSVGSISVTTIATAYNTISDYRLKENVAPLTGAIDRVNNLQVHRFNFIADPDKTVDGFIAHEAQAVVPECVTGTKDEVDADGNPVYQGIDQSKLVPLLTAALQEALQKIEDLEGRLTAAGL